MSSGDNEGAAANKRRNEDTKNRIFGMDHGELENFNRKNNAIKADDKEVKDLNADEKKLGPNNLLGARQRSFMDEDFSNNNRIREQQQQQKFW